MKQSFILFSTYLLFLSLASHSRSQELNPYDVTINRDSIILKGKFYAAEEEGLYTTVILLQGFPGGENDVLGIGSRIVQEGINVLTFNYSGTHKSEGEFNFDNSQKDIEAAFAFIHKPENILKYKIDTNRIVLGGYSFGGGMALTYAANHPEIREVFSIAGNDHGAAIKQYKQDPERKKLLDDIFDELKSRKDIVRFGPGGTVKEIAEMKIVESNPTYDLQYCAPLLTDKNILLIGGWEDVNVTIEDRLLPLYRVLKNEKIENVKFIVYHTDHSFSNVRDELANTIYTWIVIKD